MTDAAVLIVDDDADLRDLVRMIIEALGVQVFEAETCREGVDVLARERSRIRLVLLDYFMPGMQPIECAQAFLELAEPSTTIVLCTASVNPAGRATELGLTRSLGKPFSHAELEQVVGEAMGAARVA